MNAKEINVHIGQVRVAKNGEILKAILGSCVGIGMIWRRKNICGLAHCLLPESPVQTFEIGGRFVTQAVASLVALLKISDDDIEEIEVVLAGGGNMTNQNASEDRQLVGTENFQVAERELAKYGFRLKYRDVGGDEGRKIIIESESFSFRVEKIPRLAQVA